MLLLLYVAPLVFVSVLFRRFSEMLRRIARVVYSFLFLSVFEIVIRLTMEDKSVPFGKVFEILSSGVYDAVQSITFTGTMAWIKGTQLSGFIKGEIWLIAFVASIVTVHSVVALIFGKFVHQLYMKLKGGFTKEQYIILGDIESARVLIKDICLHDKKPYIILIPTQKMNDDEMLYLKCRVEKPDYLKKISKNKKYHIVLLADHEYSNLDRVYQLNESGNGNLHVTVFLNNDVVRYHDIHADKIDACITSVDQVLVEKFMKESNPFKLLKEDGAFTQGGLPYLTKPFGICVIGFGKIGQEFLLRCYETSSFLTRDGSAPFRALVIDRFAEILEQEFVNNIPSLGESGEIAFLQTTVDSAEYFDAIKERMDGLHQIVVSVGDTRQNIDTALGLCRFFDRLGCYDKRPQIVVILSDNVAGAESLFKSYPNVKMMDFNSSIFNYADLIEVQIDSVAKEINDNYNRQSGKGKPWRELGTYLQAMNRAAVCDIPTKKEFSRMCDVPEEERIEFLARYEHERWCAFQYSHGWKRLPMDELTQEERDNFITKREQQKLHACLIPWDELDDLPQSSKGEFKSYDVANVNMALAYRNDPAKEK
ncbi:MAG: hypothetical protein IJG87_09645 [Ruminococcus sp.]|nr:hypothetical protein [Ruminococcus sp.]